jgi:type VI secretion system (T6SS) effector TldE1-like protein
MPSATKSSPRVSRSKPRTTPADRKPFVLKALCRCLAVIAIGGVTVASVTMGVGWLLATFVQARSDLRTALAPIPPSSRLNATYSTAALPSGDPPPVADSSSTRALYAFKPQAIDSVAFKPPVIDALGALALVIRDAPEPEHTGSIGATYKLAALEFAPPDRPIAPPRDNPDPLPLPRARPRLAALTPADDPAVKFEQSARPARTAIYDITARTVYLPSGDRLEAHSGLGDLMDNPRYVSWKNRGATPPNTYRLTLRESLFHGVQAIRMTPVGESDMYNRDGILAHSYMLGPSGQSNGCVSFRDYPKFLQAYLRGEIDHIVVVARLANPPTQSAQASPSDGRRHRVW